MLISIIIPIFNVSNYIIRCLESAFNQTYQNIEYILVDDASPDDSMLKVKQMLLTRQSKNVKVVSHPINKGLSAARNSGVLNSNGDYCYFLDSDDEITPDCIEKLVSYLNYFPADVVIGEFLIIGGNRKNYSPLSLNNGYRLNGNEILDSFLKKKWYEMACNKLVRRDLFFDKNCWFYEGIVHEDNLWSFNLAINSSSMIICQHPTYKYYIHPGTITSKKNKYHFDSILVVMKEMIKIWEAKKRVSRKTERIFSDYICNLRIYFIKSLLRGNYELLFVKEEYIQLKKLFVKKNMNKYSSLSLSRVKLILLECMMKIELRRND